MTHFFRSFKTKVTIVFILAMFIAGAVNNFLIYEYSIRSQFEQLRRSIKVLAQTMALQLNAGNILNIPLNESGVATEEYKDAVRKLSSVGKAAPSIAYIYVLRSTEKPGIYKFVIDLHSGTGKQALPPALPGKGYDGSRFSAIGEAFNGPSADDKIVTDEWGVFLSGYAPIRDKSGKTIAILGIDFKAKEVYNLQKEVRIRAAIILFLGVLFSVIVGILLSGGVTNRINKLVEGIRHISKGDLSYRVKVGGDDEIRELARAFNHMAVNLHASREKLVNYFYRVVESLIRILEARDPYTKGHSDRVSKYSEKIALEMGLPPKDVETLREAALLHDIGKLGVHEIVLNKKMELTKDEREEIRKHPSIGEEILKPVSSDKNILQVIREHHERYDGKGYPDGLTGEKINPLAAIVSVADSYDAMTSHRAYRTDLTKDAAMEQLKENSGIQFDPKVVDAFIKVMKDEKGASV